MKPQWSRLDSVNIGLVFKSSMTFIADQQISGRMPVFYGFCGFNIYFY